MREDAQFYVGQKAFIRKGDKVLVLGNSHNHLDYPGGKIQEGETDIIASLKREVREETGLEIEVGTPFVTWTNIFPENHRLAGKRLYLVGYNCEYVSGEVTLSNEHVTFKWMTFEDYKNTDDQSAYFKILETYFKTFR